MARRKSPEIGGIRESLESTLEALATGAEHAALARAALSLADLLDARLCVECGAGMFNDALWREYRLALRNLMEATSDGGSDEFAEAVAELRAEMGHPSDS